MEILTRRDFDVLLFLWKYKLATTRAISEKFFYSEAPWGNAGYKRLMTLNGRGYIDSIRANFDRKHCWRLNEKGYKIIRDSLPLLKAKYFKPEHMGHDL